MATVKFTSIIQHASGQFGGIVFSHRKGKPYLKRYAKPRDPRTAAQVAARERFRECAAKWRMLPPEEKAAWKARARRENATGYNLFMREGMRGGANDPTP